MTAAPAPTAGDVVLRARRVTAQFGAFIALRDVDFELAAGSVHALVGENGAGKSTLMRILSGALAPAKGTLELRGNPIRFDSPRHAQRSGIRMIHQELSLVPGLSVAENIFLGREPCRRGVLDREAMRSGAASILALLGEEVSPDTPVGNLSLARRGMVEIAKALADTGTPLRVLILDEPTAILSARETAALFARIAGLSASGVSVVYCSHRLEEVAALADTVTILRDGERVACGAIGEMSRDTVIRLMVGRAVGSVARGAPRVAETPRSALRAVAVTTRVVREVSFSVGTGEVVALVGLVGAGRTELARAMVGADRRLAGHVLVDEVPVDPSSPRAAAAAGIAYVSEDRRGGAIVPHGDGRSNMILARLRSFSGGRWLRVVNRARERLVTDRWAARLRITGNLDAPVVRLSGGNQQKVVLARWLIPGKLPLRALIVDEPTRGVDVGARVDIYAALRDLASEGTAILVITSDLDEALAIGDRLLVMREGRLVGALTGADRTATQAAALMVPA